MVVERLFTDAECDALVEHMDDVHAGRVKMGGVILPLRPPRMCVCERVRARVCARVRVSLTLFHCMLWLLQASLRLRRTRRTPLM